MNKKKKQKQFTIGQFAALHGIHKKTLMWYDEIGLFRPAAIDPANGYRYYNYQQSPILETILLLRELDVPITEIQRFMKNRSAQNMKLLLEQKMTDLDLQIMHLQAVRKMLYSHVSNMDTLLTLDLSEISIVEKKERSLITVAIDRDTTFEQEAELIIQETAKYQLGRLHNASYGSMIPAASLKNGDFDDYTALFIEMPLLKHKPGLHIQPQGTYIRAFHKGDWDGIPARYEEILAYAGQKGLSLYGYSYEKGINETVIEQVADYIVQIEIPVRNRM
ncbi:MAG: MerR family transcriptional regulator [Eubacterium sp.]|nr:MerR family transcriptional regulator [Eubacterium sp.]